VDAGEVEMSSAEGEQALQALLQCAHEHAGKREAHEAEQGIFTRLMPIGGAAMTRDVAQRGTGDMGPAVTRADGVLLPREQLLRGGATACSSASWRRLGPVTARTGNRGAARWTPRSTSPSGATRPACRRWRWRRRRLRTTRPSMRSGPCP